MKSNYRGIVRNLEWKEKNYGEYSVATGCLKFFLLWNTYTRYEQYEILSFRIEQLDKEGNIIGYISVYLKAIKIEGNLVNGDEVRVIGNLDNNQRITPTRIINLTTEEYINFTNQAWNRNFKLFIFLLEITRWIIFIFSFLLLSIAAEIISEVIELLDQLIEFINK